MDQQQAKEFLLAHATDYLKKDRSGNGWICPICGSGSGQHGTGITSKDNGQHFTCWTGCFTNSDIIDIFGLKAGIPLDDQTQFPAKFRAACDYAGITLDDQRGSTGTASPKPAPDQRQPETKAPENAATDYTAFFLQANQHLSETDYYRGISLETLNKFKIGFVPEWKQPLGEYLKKANTDGTRRTKEGWDRIPASPRLIIPTSKTSYLARDIRPDLTGIAKDLNKMKVGAVHIFNRKAIKTARKPIFIVEGEIDAMSIVDVGGEAIGLGSLSNVKNLLKLIETEKPAHPMIIALDNETDPGKQKIVEKAANELASGLDKLGITFYRLNPFDPYKDANEALQGNREAFSAMIADLEQLEDQAMEPEREKLEKEAALYSLGSFIQEIEDSKTRSYIPTGFPCLDYLLDGGLYSGLYTVGAISSLGKTTFCLQIADQIAQTGKKVLIFSLEMARNELIAKSVSRLSFLQDRKQYNTTEHAKTTRGILTGSRYNDYSKTEKELIQTAINQYGEYAKNIWITEGIGNISVNEIREKVIQFITLYGEAPVVVIDYLQILAPYNERYTDKQNTDKAVLELKRLSRDYRLPVIGISSFNRDNYTAPVNLSSFKESGAIEYSSDVLIGLQYAGMDYIEGEGDKARDKRVREIMGKAIEDGKAGKAQKIQLKILKSRNGTKGSTGLDFYPMFNYFTGSSEAGTTAEEEEEDWVVIASSDKGSLVNIGDQPDTPEEQTADQTQEQEPEENCPLFSDLEEYKQTELPF